MLCDYKEAIYYYEHLLNECKKIALIIMEEIYGYNSNELFEFSISNMSKYMKP